MTLLERSSDGATSVVAEITGRRLRRSGLVLAAALPLAAFAVFFAYPVATMLSRGFGGPDGVDLSGVAGVLSRPRFARIAVFTVGQATASAALAVGFGLPGAYLLYRTRFPGRRTVRALVTVPFVLPTVVVGLAFRGLLADDGPLGSLGLDGSMASILLAHLFLNYAVVVRTVGTTWAGLDSRAEDAAASLGATPWRVFRTITLPALAPAIASAAVLVFLFCATSFGVIVVLGNGAISTLDTEIYHQTTDLLDLKTAAVLSVAQIGLVSVALAAAGWLRRRTERTLRLRSTAAAPRGLSRGDAPVLIASAAMAALLVAPVATLLVRSLRTADGWGPGNYAALAGVPRGGLISGVQALRNSLEIALSAAALAVTVGVLLCVVLARRPRQRWQRNLIGALDGFFLLPLGVSAATVGFGFLLALDEPPVDLRTSPLLVPIAQALVATPLVIRLILPAMRGIDDRLRQAAAVLGAPPGRVWLTVDLPLFARALAAAGALAVEMALGEFGATSFLSRPDRATLPIVLGRLISRPGPGNAGMAFAAGVVLAAVCMVVVLAVDRLSAGRQGGGEVGAFG